jgi:hypothetical protein
MTEPAYNGLSSGFPRLTVFAPTFSPFYTRSALLLNTGYLVLLLFEILPRHIFQTPGFGEFNPRMWLGLRDLRLPPPSRANYLNEWRPCTTKADLRHSESIGSYHCWILSLLFLYSHPEFVCILIALYYLEAKCRCSPPATPVCPNVLTSLLISGSNPLDLRVTWTPTGGLCG